MRDKLQTIRHSLGERLGRPRRWRLLERMPRSAVCAEVGVYKGDFTRDILRVAKPRELHLIDPWWTLQGRYEDFWAEERDTRAVYRQVESIAAEHAACEIHVGTSQQILPRFPDGFFDWVYLDSSHVYDQTVEELELLRRKVKPSGVIAGHDWEPDPKHVFHGVYRAVDEFCDRYGWELWWTDIYTQWAIRPPGPPT
jgi:Methyltransferase domain